jgi:O-antigen ligase
VRGALAWVRFALLLWAAEMVFRHRRARRILAAGVALAAALQVVYGAPRWIGNIATIWGVEVPGDASRLRGTFVNPDHLGQFLALGLAVVFASSWAIARNTRFDSFDRRIVAGVLPLLLWTSLFVALAFTGSRGAMVAVLVATLAQGVAIGRGPLWRRFSGAALLAFGVGSVAWIGLRQGLGRVLATSAWDLEWNARVVAAKAAVQLWLEAPWLGVGIGGFREAFPTVQPETLPGSWRHVHNNWLELLVVCGVVGAAVLLVGCAASVRVAVRRRSWPERSEDRAALVAALGVVCAVAVHEALDFGLTMPANSWTVGVVLGAGLAALGDRRDSETAELAEGDEVFDRDQQQPVGAGENFEVAEAGHGAVVLHDLADHPSGGQPRKAR